MKSFRTPLSVTTSTHLLHIQDSLVTVGSCFADAIGSRLLSFKISALQNPFGVIYNPLSIHRTLLYAIHNKLPSPETYLQHQEVHLNYDFHSSFSSLTKKELEEKIKDATYETHEFLKNASTLVLTYGTAWVYERIDDQAVVANCHKMPSNLFTKYLLHQKRIVQSFEELYHAIKLINPSIRIILTVSPVRHLKDTMELNSVSKAVLRLSCHTLSQSFDDIDYFPAYEIMMDDLRDYRFYKADMIHPTEVAEDYIWNLFVHQYFNTDAQSFMEKWRSIRAALNHRPFHPSSPSNQLFLRDTLKKLEELKSVVNVDKEITTIKDQLI